MVKIIGVKFRNVGKVYYFDPGDLDIHYNDHVIVETARGIEYGTVMMMPTEVPDEKITAPLKPVIRMADAKDDERERTNREKEKNAYKICKQKIREHGLEMKLIAAEYTFDNSKVLFYFTADGRIDFRELVKDLASVFRTRIELRQIGVRAETQLVGGYGICGRPLCCHTWLTDFAPVSIKMAKDQNLSLNPAKISGTCGRLMCCLKNEAETYAYLNKGMPSRGDYVTTPDGKHGDVQSVNILRQTVKVVVDMGNDEKELQEYDVKDITFIPKSKKPKPEQNQKNENKPERREKKNAGRKPAREEKPGTEEKSGEAAGEEGKPQRREKKRRGAGGRDLAERPAERPAEKAAEPAGQAVSEENAERRRRRKRRGKGHRAGEAENADTEPQTRSSADSSMERGENARARRNAQDGASVHEERRTQNAENQNTSTSVTSSSKTEVVKDTAHGTEKVTASTKTEVIRENEDTGTKVTVTSEKTVTATLVTGSGAGSKPAAAPAKALPDHETHDGDS